MAIKLNWQFSTAGRDAVKPISLRSILVRNSVKLTLILLLAPICLFATACSGTAKDEGPVLARVGSHDITESDVDMVIKQQVGNAGSTLTPEELTSARLSVLGTLIQQTALFAKAEKESLVPDDTKVTEESQRRIRESKLSKEDYERQLKEAGITEAQWREQIRKDMAINALVDKHVKSAPVEQPTDAEIEKYYNDRKAEFKTARGVDVSVIVTDPRRNGTADDAVGDAQAEQKIKEIHAQLKSGLDFATIAFQRSEHASQMRNGNIGFATEQDLRQTFPSLADLPATLMALRPGESTPPLKEAAAGAWLIFKLNGKVEEPRNLSLTDVRQTIVDAITQTRQQVLQNALMMLVLTETDVKNYLAQRVLENPRSLVEMRPSVLLQPKEGQQQQQQQPRFENQNQNQPAATNTNSNARGNTNSRASSNASR
jgi:hypothetical protein